MELLHADALFEMPPQPMWFVGRKPIGRFLASWVLREPGQFRFVSAAANGQPTLAAYLLEADGLYHAHAVQVLTFAGSSIARIVSFNDPGLLATFGLPPALPYARFVAR